MAYKPRAKRRLKDSVLYTERERRGSGYGVGAGQPLPIYHHLLAVPKASIAPMAHGDVNEFIIDLDDIDATLDISVYNRSSITLEAGKEYRFDWVQGYWLPYFEDCGVA